MASGDRADIIIVVGATNRDAIVEGVKTAGFNPDSLIIANDFNEAQKLLQPLLRPGSTVLYENDLPDSFK